MSVILFPNLKVWNYFN